MVLWIYYHICIICLFIKICINSFSITFFSSLIFFYILLQTQTRLYTTHLELLGYSRDYELGGNKHWNFKVNRNIL